MDAHPEAIPFLQLRQVHVLPVVSDLAEVSEQHAAHPLPRDPSILGAERHRVLIAEGELAEAAARALPADVGEHVERHRNHAATRLISTPLIISTAGAEA